MTTYCGTEIGNVSPDVVPTLPFSLTTAPEACVGLPITCSARVRVLKAQAFATWPPDLPLPVPFESLPSVGSTRYVVFPEENPTLSQGVQTLAMHTCELAHCAVVVHATPPP